MQRNIFIKHEKYKDVCCHVLKSFYTGTRYKLKIQWWNLGYVNSWCMGYTQNIEIEDSDLSNWLYTTDMISYLRNANWRKVK